MSDVLYDMRVREICVLLMVSLVSSVESMCPYIDAHWMVNYNRGLNKYSPDNAPEPPVVTQVGVGLVRVRWGHLVREVQCVDRCEQETLKNI